MPYEINKENYLDIPKNYLHIYLFITEKGWFTTPNISFH